MKAFLSHSSKDKWFVSKVFEMLGEAQAEYDEKTFEPILNVQAIRNALKRSDLFVVFLSKDSATSTYVAEEQRAALESMGRGALRRVLIIAIDETSYKLLPPWLRETNVLQRIGAPRLAASRIQATLVSIKTEVMGADDVFVNREEELQKLRKSLSAPPGEAPVALHVSGYHGIGRRTLLRHCLKMLFPRIDTPIEISMANFEGAEELYRRLFELHRVSSLAEKISEIAHFSGLDEIRQAEHLASMLTEMAAKNDFIIINDEGGVLSEDGDYQSYFGRMVESLSMLPRPILGIVQTRRMKLSKQLEHKWSHHTSVAPLRDEHVKELLSFKLKQSNIAFNDVELSDLCELVDGHPFNARFAVQYADTYGLKSLLASPSELIEWKRRQAEKFLEGIKFDEVESDIISLLRAFRYVAIETLVQIVDSGIDEITTSLRLLEDLCCVERRGDYYAIPKPLADAVSRDKRFQRSVEWEQSISKKMSGILDDYQDEDHVSISVIETATLAAIKSGIESKIVANFLLPSHLLRIGRSYYDDRKWGACLDFCEKAYGLKNRLTIDGRVESLRLLGLSAARLNDNKKIRYAISELEGMGVQNAKRQALFLVGFDARLRGHWIEAEENYLKAFAISRANMSLNRELAAIYCHQGRFAEAEDHARLAYEFSPNNPFIIDILARTISGKLSQGLSVDSSELDSLKTQLSRHENASGSSFYDVRQAEILLQKKNYSAALKSVNAAITKTPGLVSSHCLRASINLALTAIPEAEKDVNEINRLLEQAGGYSPEDEAQLKELQVKIHIEKREFQAAKDLAERSNVLPNSVTRRLLLQLAKAIGFEPKHADRQLQQWSKSYKG